MSKIRFRTAEVRIYPDKISSIFNDGKLNEFYLKGWMDDEYRKIARQYGYDDPERYAIEHELVHHFIADNMGWKWSWSLHASAGKLVHEFKGPWPDHIGWEERIVNQFQLYMKTGEKDPLNVLHLALRGDLDNLVADFSFITQMLLDSKLELMYDHNTGNIDIVGVSEITAAQLYPAE